MADSTAFDWTCQELEKRSSLDRLESRGTVRLALKQAGLEPRSVTPDQMKVVTGKILPGELESRGVDDAAAICTALASGLGALDGGDSAETPDEVFRRLGG